METRLGHINDASDINDMADHVHDYSYVDSPARIAIYDDLLSSPRIIDINPDATREFINSLATAVYTSAQQLGGSIPYSIILQVSENFIHANFREMVVSVLDGGNTIRFSDQGPGISDKDKAQQPGYSSATAPMKSYINGVGSGLPIVREYMETKNGTVHIEDNMDTGSVVTISLRSDESETGEGVAISGHAPREGIAKAPNFTSWEGAISTKPADPAHLAGSTLTPRALNILKLFTYDDVWGVKDISDNTDIPKSTVHSELKKLEEAGMMTRLGVKYKLTELGERVALNLA